MYVEPCYYSLSRSRSFRNCRVALLLCLLVMELMVFFLIFFLTGFVFNVTFRFHFVHYHSNIHACTFFFKKYWSFIHIHSSSIHYVPPIYLSMQDKSKMRLWLSMQI